MAEDPISVAERHVRHGEARVTRQLALLAGLEGTNQAQAIAQAKDLLAVLQRNLELAREHLRTEQDSRQRRDEGGSR